MENFKLQSALSCKLPHETFHVVTNSTGQIHFGYCTHVSGRARAHTRMHPSKHTVYCRANFGHQNLEHFLLVAA